MVFIESIVFIEFIDVVAGFLLAVVYSIYSIYSFYSIYSLYSLFPAALYDERADFVVEVLGGHEFF